MSSFPIGFTGEVLIKHVYELAKNQVANRREKKLSRLTSGLGSPYLLPVIEALYPKYSERLVTLFGNKFPAVTFPTSEDQWTNAESVLGNLNVKLRKSIDPALASAGDKYLVMLQKAKRNLRDLSTYCCDSIQISDNNVSAPKIDSSMGHYFDAIRSCFVLQWELLTQLTSFSPSKRHDLTELIERGLKLRRHAHDLARGGDPVLDYSGRRAALGECTMIVFKDDDEYYTVIGERSSKGVVAEEDLLALAPSGVFQPVAGEWKKEYSVNHNFYREFLEEYFGKQQALEPGSRVSYRYIYDDEEIIYLQRLRESGHAKMVTTGITVNLLNLRADISALIFIDSVDWIKRVASKVNLNDEWKRHEERSTNEERNAVPLRELRDLEMNAANTLASSAGAISLGLTIGRKLNWFDL
jgi:phosphate uptake regulator